MGSPSWNVELVPDSQRDRVLGELAPEWAPGGRGRFLDYLLLAKLGQAARAVVAAYRCGDILEIMPPTARDSVPGVVQQRLLKALERQIGQREPTTLRRLVLPETTGLKAGFLESLEYRWIAQVRYVAAPVEPICGGTSALRLTRIAIADDPAGLEALFEATWRDSRDGVNQTVVRKPGQDLAVYAADCQADPDAWYRVELGRTEIGCVLLDSTGPADVPWRIQYLGLIPAFRGRGLGRELLWAVRSLGSQAGRSVWAAVDQANLPALRAYEATGFRVWQERQLWIKQTGGTP